MWAEVSIPHLVDMEQEMRTVGLNVQGQLVKPAIKRPSKGQKRSDRKLRKITNKHLDKEMLDVSKDFVEEK